MKSSSEEAVAGGGTLGDSDAPPVKPVRETEILQGAVTLQGAARKNKPVRETGSGPGQYCSRRTFVCPGPLWLINDEDFQ